MAVKQRHSLLHHGMLAVSWLSFILLWWHAAANPGQIRVLALLVVAGIFLVAVATTFWVAWLLSIALRKSPRLQHPMRVALYVRDRLGRPVHAPWPELRQLRCLRITVDAAGKHYQAVNPPAAGLPLDIDAWMP